ncbi:hypothetical protein BDA96_06G060100 [Sorghum bicolor]|uniref:Uncharacterized protein n=2 Tax=Sorghum bicolor TaxID=4558 RepID=A0A921UBK2_SORBI|nr:hypothetical protein BDA96_06G060100 [Sorghum bicolor]OQU81410.1 hypothetical protein SORBI_3006G053601 [Sorghum bicolor]
MVSEIPGVRVLLGEGVSARVGGMGRERAARREGEVYIPSKLKDYWKIKEAHGDADDQAN